MTKKKKRQNPEIDELLARPWCYYCERDFDDLKILIHHQKAKHFKCERCARRLNTAGGLRVHMEQVHKETLEQVENALPGRESIDLEIFGTEGIPDSEVAAHNQRIMAEFTQKEADRRAASGQSNGPKKPKIDISKEIDPEEIRRKLEAHKKAMASGGGTPITPGESISPGRSQSPGGFDTHTSPAQPIQANSPPGFSQIPFGVPPPYSPTTFSPQPVVQYPSGGFAPTSQFGRGAAPQPPHPPYAAYQQSSAGFSTPKFNGLPAGQFSQAPSIHNPPRHQASTLPQPHQVPGLPPKPNIPGLPPRPAFATAGFGRGNPPPPSWSSAQHVYNPAVSSSNVPGFAAQHPFVTLPGSPSITLHQPNTYLSSSSHTAPSASNNDSVASGANPTTDTRIDVAFPSKETSAVTQSPVSQDRTEKAEIVVKPKRETKLVYNDNDVSPEEKRALLSRYAVYTGPRIVNVTA